MKIIALCAKKGSGKNHVSNIISEVLQEYNEDTPSIFRYGFADPIKEIAKVIFGWDDDRIEYEKEIVDPFYGVAPRDVLQFLGTRFGQEILPSLSYMFSLNVNRNTWMYCFDRFVNNVSKVDLGGREGYIIIHDMRFPHEERFLREHYSKDHKVRVWKVVPDFVTPSNDGHLSENLIESIRYDNEIVNYMGSRDKIKEQVKAALWQ